MTNTATALYRSIHAQPQAIRELLEDWELPTQAAERLAKAERVFLAGIGTSYHAAIVGEYLLRLAGFDAWAVRSFEFVTYPRPLRANDAVIVISHRGSKQYSTQALQRARDAQVFTVGITGRNSKMQGAEVCLETVEQDASSTHSISYTSTLACLAQIATHLAVLRGQIEEAQRLRQGLMQIPALMESMLARENELRPVAQDVVAQQRRVYIVGAGPNAATASEAALKAKEAAYITAEGFELEHVLHGSMTAFEANDMVIPISVEGAATTRMADFLLGLSEIGTRVLLLGTAPNTETAALLERTGWTRFGLDTGETPGEALPEVLTPLLAALPVQLLAEFLAEARGTNADSFRLDNEVYKRANAHFRL